MNGIRILSEFPKSLPPRGESDPYPLAMRRPVTEEFLAFLSEKTANDGDGVIALLEDEPARDETSPPLVFFRAAFAAICSDVLL